MRVTRLLATAAAVTATGVAFGTPAYAVDVSLNNDHKNRLAGYFAQQCDDERFAGLQDNEDGWHFVLPGGGTFTSISVTFDKDGVQDDNPADDVTYTGSADLPGEFVFYDANDNDKHAYLFTPAGYRTVSGTATAVATNSDKFNVSHACAGTPDEPEEPGEQPSTPGQAPSPDPSTSPGGDGGNLPRTGTATSAIIIGGVALVAGGVALLAIRRRRDTIG